MHSPFRSVLTSSSLLVAVLGTFLTGTALAVAPGPTPMTPSEKAVLQKAKALPGPMVREDTRVVINIPSRMLTVYYGDEIARHFPVGVGRIGYITPMGHFKVIRKIQNPGWENPYKALGKMRIAPGEENPLGTRWIGFHQNRLGEFGIHGTDTPASVGRFSSHGCVRMKVPDAEALFDLVDMGTPVDVVYEPVVIRREKQLVTVTVFADPFKKGTPTAEQVKAKILKQYPTAKVDEDRIALALSEPNEKSTVVAEVPIPPPPKEVQIKTNFEELKPQPGKAWISKPKPRVLQPVENVPSVPTTIYKP